MMYAKYFQLLYSPVYHGCFNKGKSDIMSMACLCIGLSRFPPNELYKYEEATNVQNKMHTCSGERGKDLFPIVNEMYGMAAILSQLRNDFPKGFGSISHSFNTWKF